LLFTLFAMALLLVTGCGGKKRARTYPPAYPPELPSTAPQTTPGAGAQEPSVPANAKPIYTEIGIASWYGPPYNNRKAATGEIYDMYQLTAAHKTLPLNSIARVTNLANGKSVVVRINDRGPFVGDRIVDLSLAAAKAIGVWRSGLARVRLDVLSAPSPINSGGRWCVQIGAFHDMDDALRLKSRLQRKYPSANVIEFTGPTGHWVRIRPLHDDRSRAIEVENSLHVDEGGVFLVRLD